jgi:hypothetical protein
MHFSAALARECLALTDIVESMEKNKSKAQWESDVSSSLFFFK